MPQHIVIVGGGVGGTIVANLLARTLHAQEAEVTLIDSSGQHVYMPLWLYMPFNQLPAQSDQLVRREQGLLNKHVRLVVGDVKKIDVNNREVLVAHRNGAEASGATMESYPYEYLILATGARLALADLSGLGAPE